MTLTLANTVNAPIADGDAGIIIRADGTPQIFNTYTPEQLADPTPAMQETTERLHAFMVAWTIPQVMDVMKTIASDPNVVGQGGITTGRPN